jgi:hypothetical protein
LFINGKRKKEYKMTATKVKDWVDIIVDKCVKIPELKARATDLGLTPGKLSKAELIREIQKAEGFTPCYGTAAGQCENSECCFVNDCKKVK